MKISTKHRPFWLPGKLRRAVCALLIAVCAVAWFAAPAQVLVATPPETGLPEYKVKAAFVYMLTRFVTWPSNTVEADEPFVVGVLGDDAFEGYLRDVLKGKDVGGRPIVIRYWRSIGDMQHADLIVISKDFRRWTDQIVDHCHGQHALTVGDYPDFAQRGGIIAFRLQDRRVNLVINRHAARDEGLELSAKLLAVAAEVIND